MNRCPEYLDFIRSKPCLVTGCRNHAEPHHWRTSWNCGVGLKPADTWAVPLCAEHHRELHDHGKKTFLEKRLGISYRSFGEDMLILKHVVPLLMEFILNDRREK